MIEIGLGVVVFTGLVTFLVILILVVRSKLVASGEVSISIDGDTTIASPIGLKLLGALAESGVHLPSACGGTGTCGQCRLWVLQGGGAILPTELARITKREARQGVRLACQVTVNQDMTVRVPEEVLSVRQWQCVVRSSETMATMIKEVVLELPAGETVNFRAGSYMQITAPPYQASFAEFDIAPAYRDEWDRLDLWRYRSISKRSATRAYSMANYSGEKGVIILNIRIAIPPPRAPQSVPPGVVSSYLFSLKPGDTVAVAGPYGHFFAADTENEMIFVGGGVGMAPMRAHILDQLKRVKSRRKMTFWYGARNRREMFYVEQFDRLQDEYENFEWFVALSEPKPEDGWTGKTGFIHQVLYEEYLRGHPAPENCEYYVCGPPMMLRAVLKMLDNLGVDTDNIFYDEFGG
jgi:Na+-transporting NADH:ubiquinone oxidoreductase subunit F